MSETQQKWLAERIRSRFWGETGDHREGTPESERTTVLRDWLQTYFGGIYDIERSVALVDRELASLDEFDFVDGNDAFDLAAVQSTASPRAILDGSDDDCHWVPFETTALIFETEGELTERSLGRHVGRFRSVSCVSDAIEGNEADETSDGSGSLSLPIRCLVYGDAAIDDDTFDRILRDNRRHWDLVLIAEAETLIVDRSVPLTETFVPSSKSFFLTDPDPLPSEMLHVLDSETDVDTDPDIVALDDGIVWFLIFLSNAVSEATEMSTDATDALRPLADQPIVSTRATTKLDPDDDHDPPT